ncbi:hypothetical protein HBI23_257770 [Parastagonospora nodorum]|nr:hypothetical protein HBI23_257770 [Parastagonospora nodorum]KAH5618978.1 hypothetical protein HBI51_252830 [Parastagonospora nodorum]KAH5982689.1 hypothetical protein HBI84_250540 [Parastagonospora nodorum]KAH6131743.1 hypothetical protein HBI68_255930 [Parastagonospora nodorum]KAH6378228.1 hypothetical protein HBI08_242380 [Parastagonospora nodorum]
MATVFLAEREKTKVLNDIEEYLSVDTVRLHENTGTPWRRGYKLHGPPGTGKTSFVLALAASFDLDIYVLSSLDSDVQDSDLSLLFSKIPERSIVLIEDIDSANFAVGRSASPPQIGTKNDQEKKGGTTLSGLLNAIDGVASQDGHVLIITTNHPECLDPALTRAGRIDVEVCFTHITPDEACKMFKTFYSTVGNGTQNLNDWGDQLARAIPRETLTPADVQNQLVMNKYNPGGAVDGVKELVRLRRTVA